MSRLQEEMPYIAVGISLRLQGKHGFPYNVKKYVLLC